MGKQVSEETVTTLEGLRTEVVALKVMGVRDEADKAHNQAMDTALRLIDKYKRGEGLFQQ